MSRVIASLSAVLAFGGCADLIGAEFDVDPLGEGGNATAAATTGAGGSGGGMLPGCPAGSTAIVTDGQWPYGIAAGVTGGAAGWIYFTELTTPKGRVRRVRSDGSGGPELVADNLAGPSRIVIDDQFAYFPEWGTGSADGNIWRASVSSKRVEVVASAVRTPNGIALSSTDVFWTSTLAEGGGHWVYRRPVDFSLLPTKFALGSLNTLFLTVSDERLFGTAEAEYGIWSKELTAADGLGGVTTIDTTTLDFRPSTIRATSSGVAVVSYPDGEARAWDVNLATTKVLGSGFGELGDLVVDGSTAYWAAYTEGALYKNSVDGGTPTPVAALPNINGLASDGEALYLTQHLSPGLICRLPLDGL